MSPILGIYASQISGHLWAPSGAYDSIATVTVGAGGASTISFTGIPSGYQHLQIRAIGRTTSNGNMILRLGNGSIDTGANYSWHILYGDGSSAASVGGANQSLMYLASIVTNANIFGATVIDILDYKDTNKNKTIRALEGYDINGSGIVQLTSGNWRNTAAINTLQITCVADFTQYSTFALYGIKGGN